MAQMKEDVRLYIMPKAGMLAVEPHTKDPKTGEYPEGSKVLDISDAEAAARYVIAKAMELEVGIRAKVPDEDGYDHDPELIKDRVDSGWRLKISDGVQPNGRRYAPLMIFSDPDTSYGSAPKRYV